jgi:hypothetical protein
MPSSITTPGKPVNVTVTMDANGNIVVQNDAVPLATRYRYRMLLVGIQIEYQLAARSTEPVGIIPGVMPGQTVQIVVQAVNGNLQGVASDPVVFTVPLAVAKAPEATAMPGLDAQEALSADGARNGHGALGKSAPATIGARL